MRNLLIVLTAAAFGLAALPADAAFKVKKKGADKAAAKSDAKKAGKKGVALKKDPK